MGDPAGIGPEIILKAFDEIRRRPGIAPQLVAIGSAAALHHTADALELPAPPVTGADDVETAGPLSVLSVGDDAVPAPGRVSPEGGRLAFLAIKTAVDLSLAGRIDGIVTAPLNKEALNLAGYRYSGHTDMLADLTGTRDTVMMLAHGTFRVTHLSTHVALADVPRLLTAERLNHVLRLTHDALSKLGIAEPRIAVAALNPHAGEGGIFGREDMDVTAPVVAEWQRQGHAVQGPVPGDTVFVNLRAGRYDAVVAMYHDQGHIPVKLLGFRTNPDSGAWEALNGVNVTLGLPIIRTSVDHGTAFDIAGQGCASAESLVEAIDYAVALAEARNKNGQELLAIEGGTITWQEANRP
jgi:4-hydroxythreonine-4-phosphate dehydrogenase